MHQLQLSVNTKGPEHKSTPRSCSFGGLHVTPLVHFLTWQSDVCQTCIHVYLILSLKGYIEASRLSRLPAVSNIAGVTFRGSSRT